MAPRLSTIYLGTTSLLLLALTGMLLSAASKARKGAPDFSRKRALVRQLALTDLCLFTEASYTRHPSMADSSTAFQDAPMSMEHFPSGAMIGPPPPVARDHVQQD